MEAEAAVEVEVIAQLSIDDMVVTFVAFSASEISSAGALDKSVPVATSFDAALRVLQKKSSACKQPIMNYTAVHMLEQEGATGHQEKNEIIFLFASMQLRSHAFAQACYCPSMLLPKHAFVQA
jgi:hypothetical protein